MAVRNVMEQSMEDGGGMNRLGRRWMADIEPSWQDGEAGQAQAESAAGAEHEGSPGRLVLDEPDGYGSGNGGTAVSSDEVENQGSVYKESHVVEYGFEEPEPNYTKVVRLSDLFGNMIQGPGSEPTTASRP